MIEMCSPTDAALEVPSNDKTPDAISDLARAIRRTIKPWQQSPKKPPLTEEQLVIIALVWPQKRRDIFYWIFDNFRHRRILGRNHLWEIEHATHETDQNILSGKARLFRGAFEQVIWQYEVPLLESGQDGVTSYEISEFDAEQLLTPILQPLAEIEELEEVDSQADINDPNEPKPSPFSNLPAELRNLVYEEVFQFLKAGVFVAHPYTRIDWNRYSQRRWLLLLFTQSLDEGFDREK